MIEHKLRFNYIMRTILLCCIDYNNRLLYSFSYIIFTLFIFYFQLNFMIYINKDNIFYIDNPK